MVTQWQNLFYEDRYSHTHQQNPNFIKLAEAMGVQARKCTKPDKAQRKEICKLVQMGEKEVQVATPLPPFILHSNCLRLQADEWMNERLQRGLCGIECGVDT